MALRIENKLVADGQALANRIVTLRSQSSIPAFAFRKAILPTKMKPDEDRAMAAWGGLAPLSENDEHAIDYKPLGHAMVVILDAVGGNIHDSGDVVMPEQMTARAMIEPYDINLKDKERYQYRPDFDIKKGDLICLLLNNYKEYYQCTGVEGLSMLPNQGKRYILSQAPDLEFLEVFDEEGISDTSPY